MISNHYPIIQNYHCFSKREHDFETLSANKTIRM